MQIKDRFSEPVRLSVLLILGTVLWLCAACGSRNEAGPPSSRPSAESSAQPAAEANDDRPVIVALGNSLTAGHGVDPDQDYPSRLQRKIDAEGYRYRVVNAGVSGDTSAQGLNRLAAVREVRPSIVIVELGANDGLRGLPVEATRQNLSTIVRELRTDGADVILAGMVLPPNYGASYTSAFRRLFPDLAREHGVSLVPFFLQGVAGRPDLNQEDGIHPTAEGYRIVVENVWPVLKPLLLRKS